MALTGIRLTSFFLMFVALSAMAVTCQITEHQGYYTGSAEWYVEHDLTCQGPVLMETLDGTWEIEPDTCVTEKVHTSGATAWIRCEDPENTWVYPVTERVPEGNPCDW